MSVFFINPFLFEAGADFESIATVTVGSGGAANIEFTSISGSYQHLQIRMITTTANDAQSIYYQFNSDTGSNYVAHALTGDGATARGRAVAAAARGIAFGYETGTDTTYQAGIVIDILDYASTSKNKTVRALGGQDSNGSGEVNIFSGLWMSTSAITSVKLYAASGNLKEHTTAALYGIKAP